VRRVAPLAVVVALAAMSACASSADDQSTARKGSAKRHAVPTRLTADNPGCQYIVTGTEKRSTTPSTDLEYMTGAVAEPAACYDKVTFEFDKGDGAGLPPGYTVEYRKKPFGLTGPDGKAIATSTGGFKEVKAVLYVEMQPTSTQDHRNPRRSIDTYPGNLRLLLKGMKHVVIVEWVQKLPESLPSPTTTTSSAAPVVQRVVWLIGLDQKRPFTVDYASEPNPHVSVLIMH
jgi:hypothetical protein